MALSPKQLRLVFAKLRAKGLLKYTRRMNGGAATLKVPGTERATKGFDSIFSSDKAKLLEARLPAKHRKLSTMTSLKIWDGSVLDEPGTVGMYETFTGRVHVSRSPVEYAMKKGYSSRPLHRPAGSILSRFRTIRNAKIGAAKSFYHEYGHSIYGQTSSVQKQSFPMIGEWDDVPSRGEAFAEAYGAYSTSKFSKNTLRKERPLSFKYMKRFFEEK